MKKKKTVKLVEVARSFSFKLNMGNYESQDFFCSQKAECKESEAEKVSEGLYAFCKAQVMKAVNEVRAEKDQKVNGKAREIEKAQESKQRALEGAAENQE